MFSNRMKAQRLSWVHHPSGEATTAWLLHCVYPASHRPAESRTGFCQTIQFFGTAGSGWSSLFLAIGTSAPGVQVDPLSSETRQPIAPLPCRLLSYVSVSFV